MIKVLLGRDSRSVRALVPGVKVRGRGFHEVTLLDMGDIAGPDVSIAGLSLLRLQWPVPGRFQHDPAAARVVTTAPCLQKVVSRHLRPTWAPSVGRRFSWTCPDTFPTITWNSRSYGAARCCGVPYGKVRHKIVWNTYVWHMSVVPRWSITTVCLQGGYRISPSTGVI